MPATIQALQEGRYTIEQDLPSVENFTIFQAFDTNDEVPVAIVEVPIALSRIATAAQREAAASSFAEHAKRLAAFAHKSVVAVRGHFTEDGRNYLVTDAIDGVDLAAVLAGQQRPVPVPELTEWADAVLDALNLMHNSRPPIVYRNVRPGNIVLRSDRTVQLTAAGMFLGDDQSSSAGAARGNSSLVFSPLEQIWSGLDAASQKVILSKYDDASERNLKQAPDARSDIFSLGATLYNLSTGQTPADALERSIEMIEGNPDPLISPNKLVPEIPFEVSDVIMKARTIFWNGPMGAFETAPFDAATVALAKSAAALTREGALVSVAGGGDTVAALHHAGVADDFSYISTAGGAFLEWMEGKPLPGVEALRA